MTGSKQLVFWSSGNCAMLCYFLSYQTQRWIASMSISTQVCVHVCVQCVIRKMYAISTNSTVISTIRFFETFTCGRAPLRESIRTELPCKRLRDCFVCVILTGRTDVKVDSIRMWIQVFTHTNVHIMRVCVCMSYSIDVTSLGFVTAEMWKCLSVGTAEKMKNHWPAAAIVLIEKIVFQTINYIRGQ